MSRPTAQIMHEDLLYLIFLHALPSKIKSDGSRIEIGTVEPMNFSMVCRSWRAVVLSHSILWSRIIIHHDGYRPKPVSPSLRLFLSKWLRHSKNSPLSINFDLHRLDVKGDIVTKDIVAIALSQHSRLEDVVISLGYASTKEPFTIQISPKLARLSLSIGSGDFRSPSRFAASLDFTSCGVCATLRELHVSWGVQWVLPKHHTLSLPNLINLGIRTDLNGGNINDFLAIVSACPNIIKLFVCVRNCILPGPASASTRISSSIDPILLSKLTTLSFRSENRSVTQQLLGWLRCPSLRFFSVQVPHIISSRSNPEEHCMTLELLNAYNAFFARSRPPLQQLILVYFAKLSSYHDHGRVLRDMLRHLPSLERLSLDGFVVDDQLFEAMTFHDGDGTRESVICPLLSTFTISDPRRYSDNSSCSVRPEIVDSMIVSRRRTPGYALKIILLRLQGYRCSEGL